MTVFALGVPKMETTQTQLLKETSSQKQVIQLLGIVIPWISSFLWILGEYSDYAKVTPLPSNMEKEGFRSHHVVMGG